MRFGSPCTSDPCVGRARESRVFEDTLSFHATARARPRLARTLLEYAALLLTRGRPRDRARTIDLLDRAETIARTLGMVHQADPVETLRESRPSSCPHAPRRSPRATAVGRVESAITVDTSRPPAHSPDRAGAEQPPDRRQAGDRGADRRDARQQRPRQARADLPRLDRSPGCRVTTDTGPSGLSHDSRASGQPVSHGPRIRPYRTRPVDFTVGEPTGGRENVFAEVPVGWPAAHRRAAELPPLSRSS